MGIDRMSTSWVSRICSPLGESSADLQERDPSDVVYPYIRLNATYIKRRGAGHVQSNALVTAIGVGSGGYRRLLRLDAIDAKPYDGRKSLQLSLHARGVDGVICVTGDTHEGLERAIQGGSSWAPRRGAASRQPRAKRRSRVVQVFPSWKSLIRMMVTVFSEMAGDWAGRRRFGDDSIGRAVEGAKVNEPAHANEGTAAERADGIFALMVADNPIPARKWRTMH